MTTTFLIQSTAQSVVAYLETTEGDAATGLEPADVQVSLKNASDTYFEAKSLDGDNFVDLGDGFYSIGLNTTDTGTLGNLHIRVTGPGIRTTLIVAYVAVATPEVPPTSPTITTSTIFGFLKKADGSPLSGASVYARPLSNPTVLHSGMEGMGVSTDAVTARSDASGYFSLSIAAGMAVDFSIPAVNFRRTFTVPGSTTNVFDIA